MILSSCQFSTHGELFDSEEKLIAQADTYSFLGKLENDGHMKFKRFSGIYTLKSINESNQFTLNLNLEIESGRFKCFLVTNDDQIIELNEGDNHIPSDGSRLRLRIAGDEAKGELSFTIK